MKIIITENNIEKSRTNLMGSIDRLGLLRTIKALGGLFNFEKLLPDYFNSKQHKIDLINELIDADKESEGRIYLYEISTPNISLIIGREESSSGSNLQRELDYVEKNVVGITIWEYDGDGNINDEPWDFYDVYLEDLKNITLDTIFRVMVNHYLR